MSVPGVIGRWMSALSAVAVRRGSTTISVAPAATRSMHPQEQHRVALGHVRADDEEHVGVVDVVVAAGRPVGAERQLVAAAGAGHAQPRVGLDVGGADEALGQLVGEVLRLRRHLPRDVQRDGVGAVLVEHAAQPGGGPRDRRVGADRHGLGAAVVAGEAGRHPARRGEHLGARHALRAQAAGVGRVLRVAGGPGGDAPTVGIAADVQHDAAADAAVRALGAHGLSSSTGASDGGRRCSQCAEQQVRRTRRAVAVGRRRCRG